MEETLKKILGVMEYQDLLKLQNEVNSGAYMLQHMVNKKVHEVETTHRKICASCGKEMNLEIDDPYTLLFGEKTIRKKASFCGMDCLHDFLGAIKFNKNQCLQKER